MPEINADEILGKAHRVQPRSVPFGYQVEQWERHEEAYQKAKASRPGLNVDDFLIGWNAAFGTIYGGK